MIGGDNTDDFLILAVTLSGYTVDFALLRNPFLIAGVGTGARVDAGAVVGVEKGLDVMVLSVLICIDNNGVWCVVR